ncbi:MAG: protein phosphatase 2C domain-containing protein [Bacteroidota bacterium]
MIIHHTQIGSHHTNHNEDALVFADLTEHHQLLAVMDGCSMGTDSHFASTLVGKTLRKIAHQTNLRTFAESESPDTKTLLRRVVEQLFTDLRTLSTSLDLQYDELLTTLVLAIVDQRGPQAEVIVIGDGLVACDEEILEFDQQNQPDYLGYHLREDFTDWWSRQDQRVRCADFLDLALATDGVLSFRPYSPDPFRPVSQEEITEFLLTGRDDGDPETLYRRKLLHVRDGFGLEPTDDLTVVRYLVD